MASMQHARGRNVKWGQVHFPLVIKVKSGYGHAQRETSIIFNGSEGLGVPGSGKRCEDFTLVRS